MTDGDHSNIDSHEQYIVAIATVKMTFKIYLLIFLGM